MNTKISSKEKKKQEKRSRAIKRLVFDLFIFLLLITLGTILLIKALKFESEKIIKYNETSDLDYKVYLVKNDFYEQEYLGKDMLYVANLIDKIVIDFDYNFESEVKENIDFDYSIVAKLSIDNSLGTKSYFEKTYTLLENKTVNMKDTTGQSIKEEITLDYPYYNSLANKFKNQYAVDAESKLTVYMVINKKNTEESSYILNSSNIMNIVIPLSERSVDIKLDYKKIDETNNIIQKQKMTINDILPLIFAVVFVALSLVMIIKAIRNIKIINNQKSAYDKYIAKILKEYDRLIAESSTLLSFDNKEIINISKFTELLDIHDNLQKPIMYYEERPHELSYFYINHDNLIYLFEVDSTELNVKE